jgi:hypothetical protein
MNENDENVVDTTENVVEQTTEQIAEGAEVTTEEKSEGKTYTDADIEKLVNERVDKLLPSKIERAKSKIQREYEDKMVKYEQMENILKAGMKTEDTDDLLSKMTTYYEEQGVEIPKMPKYSERQVKLLGEAEAQEIIDSGYDDIVSETDRLASKGLDKMNDIEKITFQRLAAERKRQEAMQELNKIGVGIEELDKKEYREFAEKLNPSMSEKDKYEMYLKFRPKKEVKPIGSMKGTDSSKEELKDFYTFEEASKFTRKQLHDNPKLLDIIQKSASEW